MRETESVYFLNGRFVPKSEAKVSVMDLGWVRGYGVFDYLITYHEGKPFFLDKHISRLRNSANTVGLPLPWDNKKLEALVHETLKRNKSEKEKAIRIVVTGGVSQDSITPAELPSIAILVDELRRYPGEYYERGISIITVDHRRFLPEAKSLNYLFAIMALQEAKSKGAIEALYVDEKDDIVFEGTTSNVFMVKEGQIFTPRTEILPGITREVILKICMDEGLPMIERDITIDKLYKADEIFLTASNKEVMPVVKINAKIVGDGNVGPTTTRVMSLFRRFIGKRSW